MSRDAYVLITAFNFKPEITPSFSVTSLVTLNSSVYSALGHSTYMRYWMPLTGLVFLFGGGCSPMQAMASPFTRFLDHTRHATLGRTPLDE